MHRRRLILAVLFVARTAMGFQYQTVASTAPSLLRDLHMGFAELGELIGLYHICGVVLSLPGGLIIRRIGDKNPVRHRSRADGWRRLHHGCVGQLRRRIRWPAGKRHGRHAVQPGADQDGDRLVCPPARSFWRWR
jgi:hypothetical protein